MAGRPHEECIRTIFDSLTESEIEVLISETQEEDNRVVAELGGALYPGVAGGLLQLSKKFPLFIVSNCQRGYIETFLKWSGYTEFFQDFECWGNTGLSKAENLRMLMDRNGLGQPVYIGDTVGDQRAADSCGVPFFFVKYGFGSCERAHFHASSFEELAQYFLERMLAYESFRKLSQSHSNDTRR